MPLQDRVLSIRVSDIGTAGGQAGSGYAVSPVSGRVTRIIAATDLQATTTAAVITPAIAAPGSGTFVAMGGTMSIGTAVVAGQSVDFTPSGPNFVQAGGTIRVASDGGPANTPAGYFTVIVREGGAA